MSWGKVLDRGPALLTVILAGCPSATTTVLDAGIEDAAIHRDAEADAASGDAEVPDALGPDATSEADGGAPRVAYPSCRALHEANALAPSGSYRIDPDGPPDDGLDVYCEMNIAGGGWTEIHSGGQRFAESAVDRLVGASARQMVKCTEEGLEHIISPLFSADWSFGGGDFQQLAGSWVVNGGAQPCGADPEFTALVCPSWWGFGCGSGPGDFNKLFPGVTDAAGGTCADDHTAHTNGAFSVCGDNNYSAYRVFVRDENPVRVLDGLRTDLACTSPHAADSCSAVPSGNLVRVEGVPGVTYDVKLRVRGVVETTSYVNGTPSGPIYIGGDPEAPGDNSFSIRVSSPDQIYYLNPGTTTRTPQCFALDFEVTIPVDGEASVNLFGNPRDDAQIINIDADGAPIVIPELSPAPEAFDGQFVHLTVLDVTRR